jgi:hypothetical protein
MIMKNPKCEVVKFTAPDGYIYTGLLYRSDNAQTTIIHVHGMCGNMLSFSSLVDLADTYQKNGYNLLTFNLKVHDCIAEGIYTEEFDPKDEFYYVGGSLEPFERRFIDIQCAIDYAKSFSKNIILQGHSMGCESIIAFQITTKIFCDTILISPCDAYKLHADFIYPKTIEEQLVELESFDNDKMLPSYFYGINCPTYTNISRYTIPIYKKAMKSILTGLALKVFRQDVDLKYFLPVSCICLLGKNDPMQTYHHQKAFDMLTSKFTSFKGIALEGDHEMKPCQIKLADEIMSWLRELNS